MFHLGCLWTLVLFGVGGSVDMYEGLMCILLAICHILDSRFGIFIVVFLWCMHKMRSASVSMRGSLFSLGGIVGSMYVIESGGKYIMTWVSSNMVLYGVSFIVHSSSGIVRMVIVSWFSCAARRAQCMAFVCFLCYVGEHILCLSIYV